MQNIQISPIPNQSFSVTIDQNFYNIAIKETNNCMSIDIQKNGEYVIRGSRIISNYPIISYRYLEDGNFLLNALSEDIPYYDKFGISQFLIYASQDELESIRGKV